MTYVELLLAGDGAFMTMVLFLFFFYMLMKFIFENVDFEDDEIQEDTITLNIPLQHLGRVSTSKYLHLDSEGEYEVRELPTIEELKKRSDSLRERIKSFQEVVDANQPYYRRGSGTIWDSYIYGEVRK